jgi:hypothetical protein
MQPQALPAGPRHLVYNQRTGRIVSTYTHFDAASGAYQQATPEQVLDLTSGTVASGDRDDGLGVLAVEGATPNVAATHLVDVQSQTLVPRYQLLVAADRTQLDGDGADTATITVSVADETGAAVDSFDGDLRAVTSRGKLSAPGGRITAAGGAATFRLTATAETVARVRVTVSDPSGRITAGSADLEFL